MNDRHRVARDTTVETCQALLGIEPLLVPLDADLREVVRLAARQSATRLIGVVSPDGRLQGVIPLIRVAESIIARVEPETLMLDVEDAASATEFGHRMDDRVASDIMLPPAAVVGSDTVGDAFRVIHRRRIAGVYIVDDDQRPTGYLDLLELALVYVEALGDASMTAPDATAPGDSASRTKTDGQAR